MNLKICKLHPAATVPTYAHGNDACFDLTAATRIREGNTNKLIWEDA